VLKAGRTAAAALLLAGLSVAAVAQDDEPDDSLRRPQQLTVGVADQLLGQLSPDGKTLLFVSNRSTTNEIFQQDLASGRARRLFDEGTDVSWPRLSPDGRRLLYVSFRDQATGQLCVRDLPDGGDRRCLQQDGSALQAEWIDAARIALVHRASIDGDLTLQEVQVGDRLEARPLPARNLTSPAISPDGRWVVYVPVVRRAPRIGPAFAAQAAGELEALRLDRPGPPVKLEVQLPGQTGQPAFSRDGRHLYLVQFFSDTNRDGLIDADDHGVLFRVPWAPARDDAPARAAQAAPEQLTDGSWNCQYPAPAADRLIATCSREHGLDVYELPLEGEVPSDWSADRLLEEIELGGSRADQLLLYRDRLLRETTAAARRLTMVRLVRLHLDADEFAPAQFYARQIQALRDPATEGLSGPLLVLVEQRRARRQRERGRLGPDFEEAARRRLDQLATDPKAGPASAVVRRVVRSEIEDDLGDEGAARRELEAAVVDDTTPRSMVELYAARADALYRELDDAAALEAVCARLSNLAGLTPGDRLRYALAAMRARVRGQPFDQADQRLALRRAQVPPDSELAFALDLGRTLLAMRDPQPPPAALEAVRALYARQTRADRRRAVMTESLRRAGEVGADRLVEDLVQTYLGDVKPGTTEYRRAARLYRRVMVGRAYRRREEKRLDEARADFEAVATRAGSYDGLIGALDLRLRAGETAAALRAQFPARAGAAPDPMGAFARAYLLARELPKLDGEAHARASAAAIAELKSAWGALRNNRAAQSVYGAVLHEQFLRTGDPAAAERAAHHYLVARDLVRSNVRYRATILGQLGLLQMAAGNYRIALSYLEERERLPFRDSSAGLSVKLATARGLLHVGREKDAAQTADAALAMLDAQPRLQRYRPLVLDRAALCHLAAGDFARALAFYDAEVALVDAAGGTAPGRNRLVVRLARAAAAAGVGQPRRALADLAVVDGWLADPAAGAALRWPHATPEDALSTYRLIAAGLRANADLALGDLDGASRALERRRTLFAERLKRSDRDPDLRALTLVELRLATAAATRRAYPDAGRWVGAALDHADLLVKRTHADADPSQLDTLWLAAQLGAVLRAPLPFKLADRLREAYDRLARHPDRYFRTYRAWLEAYLALATAAPP
jgi:hypothetical protein